MRGVLAIATQSVRQAVRSRVVWMMLALLLLSVVGLPLTIQGDGTLAGQVSIVLRYTLGAVRMLLSVAVLWAGCSAVAAEIRERQMHMVITKPVSAAGIWLGKWLGLTLLTGFMLAVCGATTYGLLRWTTRPSVLTEEEQLQLRQEVLVARRVVVAPQEPLEERVQAEFERRRATGTLPPGVPHEEALAAIAEGVRLRAAAIPSGGRRQWRFDLGRSPAPHQALHVEFRLASSGDRDASVTGRWRAGAAADALTYSRVHQAMPGGLYSLPLPAGVTDPGGRMVLEYGNIDPFGVTVLFMDPEDVRVLVEVGGFGMNYLRALLMLWIRLSLLAAIGVTAGICFSLPVAAFVSAWLLLLLSIGGFLETLAVEGGGGHAHGAASLWQGAGMLLFRLLHRLIGPLHTVDPLEEIISGRLVGWSTVAVQAGFQVLLLAGLLGLLGHTVLSRREIGLPST